MASKSRLPQDTRPPPAVVLAQPARACALVQPLRRHGGSRCNSSPLGTGPCGLNASACTRSCTSLSKEDTRTFPAAKPQAANAHDQVCSMGAGGRFVKWRGGVDTIIVGCHRVSLWLDLSDCSEGGLYCCDEGSGRVDTPTRRRLAMAGRTRTQTIVERAQGSSLGTIGQWGCKGKCACGLCAVSYPCAKAAEVAAVFKTRVQDVDPFIQAWGSTSEEPSFCVA